MPKLSRKNWIAIAVGVVVTATPLFAFQFWLGRVIDRQGRDDVSASARRTVTLAEFRVSEVIAALDGLAARGVNSCRPGDVEAMRAAAFVTAPLKEIAVVGPTGQTLCIDAGQPAGRRRVLSSEPLPNHDGYWLDVIEIDRDGNMVRLRKAAAEGNGLAALMPANLFLPLVANQGGRFVSAARIATAGGALINEIGPKADWSSEQVFVTSARSEKFGFHAEVTTSRADVIAHRSDFEWIGLVLSGVVAALLLGFAIMRPQRQPANPVAEIQRALEAGEFVPYYQPIVDIRSGQLRGAEVLVRWRKPDGSLVLPGSFIPLAESSELIRPMTLDLMRRVCVEAGAVLKKRPGLKVSFNFAGALFKDETIVEDVRKVFAGSPIQLSQVVIEVTERDPIENLTATRQIIAALQGLGARVAIDDVGTGHSGLSYLLKLGVDIIKIDKMFVDAIGTDRNSATIVETLIDLAHNMRMDVVAEGVESFEQVGLLRDLGIRAAQGYVFAPPLPGSAFLALVEAIDPVASGEAKLPNRYISARTRAA